MAVGELNKLHSSKIRHYRSTNGVEIELISKIDEANNELAKAGRSILQVARLLSQVKILVKNKNWVEFTDSGALVLPGRVARDLASAYENWLVNSSIPEAALTQVSARTLARIGKVEHSLRLQIEDHLKQETKYTERDLYCFLKKPISKNKSIKELTNQGNLSAENMTDEEKLEKFHKLFIENIQLKKTVRELETKLLEYKLN